MVAKEIKELAKQRRPEDGSRYLQVQDNTAGLTHVAGRLQSRVAGFRTG
ncbi:hypothetical protein SBA3_1960029 [Candidatus Sulfopaludibacter sp. SbA3]|nr:hypothetical protein SBA3_1960029 [Candidatus Sulfopaludibacter sp. SbA3]